MSTELEELTRVAGELPPALLRHLIEYAKRFQGPYWTWPGYSGEWTEEDMRDFSAAAMKYYDEQYPEDEGYGDPAQPR